MRNGAEFMTPQLTPLHTEARTPDLAWHLPLPYVLGSLAAMLVLIALALVVLVCSYCRLSGFFDADDVSGDPESDEKPANGTNPATALSEQFVVVMAGDDNPTFLAYPIARKAAVECSKEKSEEDDRKKLQLPVSGEPK